MPFDLDFKTFDFEEQAIRTIMRDGEPWFVAADVCRVLEIVNSRDAVSRLDEDEKDTINLNTVGLTDGIAGNPNASIISESGLYALVIRSDKPNAKRFRKWVTSVVLPSIRKTGSYVHPQALTDDLSPVAGLEEMSHRSFDGWIKMVREARILGGDAAGRRMWAKSPLPALDPEYVQFTNEHRGLGSFIADCFTVTGQPGDWVLSAEVYDAYAAWAQGTGQPVWSATTFQQRFSTFVRHFVCPATGRRLQKTKSSLMRYAGLALKT